MEYWRKSEVWDHSPWEGVICAEEGHELCTWITDGNVGGRSDGRCSLGGCIDDCLGLRLVDVVSLRGRGADVVVIRRHRLGQCQDWQSYEGEVLHGQCDGKGLADCMLLETAYYITVKPVSRKGTPGIVPEVPTAVL